MKKKKRENIFFLGDFPVARMKKKKSEKKKYSKFESQYSKLYCDRHGLGAQQGRAWWAMIRPREGTTRPAGLRYSQRHGQPRARACGRAPASPDRLGECRDT